MDAGHWTSEVKQLTTLAFDPVSIAPLSQLVKSELALAQALEFASCWLLFQLCRKQWVAHNLSATKLTVLFKLRCIKQRVLNFLCSQSLVDIFWGRWGFSNSVILQFCSRNIMCSERRKRWYETFLLRPHQKWQGADIRQLVWDEMFLYHLTGIISLLNQRTRLI